MKRNITSTKPSLTERDARQLAKQIVKDASNVRVKFGTTNGRLCLHVYVPGSTVGRTIYSAGEWDSHPANQRANRNKNFAAEQATEALMANKDAI
jgi:hypothetical protein